MDMMKAMMQSMGEDLWSPKGTAKEMIALLDKAVEGVANHPRCPFKVGDYVTPKKRSGKKGRGMPHKIIEVFELRKDVPKGGDPLRTSDMDVIIRQNDGDVLTYQEDSIDYELFDAEKVSTD